MTETELDGLQPGMMIEQNHKKLGFRNQMFLVRKIEVVEFAGVKFYKWLALNKDRLQIATFNIQNTNHCKVV